MREFTEIVEVCAHHVTFCYWSFNSELTDELKASLREDAEERIKECVTEGCVEGELCYFNQDQEEEIRGGWSIIRS